MLPFLSFSACLLLFSCFGCSRIALLQIWTKYEMKTLSFFCPLIFTTAFQVSQLFPRREVLWRGVILWTMFKSQCEPLSEDTWTKNPAFLSLRNFVLESMKHLTSNHEEMYKTFKVIIPKFILTSILKSSYYCNSCVRGGRSYFTLQIHYFLMNLKEDKSIRC